MKKKRKKIQHAMPLYLLTFKADGYLVNNYYLLYSMCRRIEVH